LEGSIGANLDQDSSVGCVVDFFGPSELLTMGDHPSKIDHNAANSPESRLIGGALQEHQEKARHASPIAYVTEGDAAFLIVHGTSDELVPYQQSVDLNQKLVAAGVPSNLITIEGGGHGNFGAAAPEIQTLVRTFLSKHLGGARDIETTDRTLKSD
ncbi:MAG: prolyl oligopeptidase family serine peptidase, partial [Verrucomicrobiales bacterium]